LTRKIFSLLAVVVLVLALGSMAKADTVNTLYCTGASSTSCFTNVADAGSSYWTLTSDMKLGAGSSFTYTLTVSATNESSPGYMEDFSTQYFFGGGQLTNLAWVSGENPGGWVDLSASKAGNNGSCQGSSPGAFCGSVDLGGTRVYLGSGPVKFGVTGNYTGTFLSDGTWNFQAAASKNIGGPKKGGNVFAISVPVTAVPEPGSLTLFGTGLLTLAGLIHRRIRHHLL
jgi:hypothetical protein